MRTQVKRILKIHTKVEEKGTGMDVNVYVLVQATSGSFAILMAPELEVSWEMRCTNKLYTNTSLHKIVSFWCRLLQWEHASAEEDMYNRIKYILED